MLKLLIMGDGVEQLVEIDLADIPASMQKIYKAVSEYKMKKEMEENGKS